MAILQELGRRAPGILPPVLGALAFSYFAYHAVNGGSVTQSANVFALGAVTRF